MNLSKDAAAAVAIPADDAGDLTRARRVDRMRASARRTGDEIEMVVYPRKATRPGEEVTFPKIARKAVTNSVMIGLSAFLSVCSAYGVYAGVFELDASGFLEMVDAVMFTSFCAALALSFAAATALLVKEVVSNTVQLRDILGGRVVTDADRRALEEAGDLWGLSNAGVYMSLSSGEEKTVPWVAIQTLGRDTERPGDIFVGLPGGLFYWITDAATDDGLGSFQLEAVLRSRWLRWRGRRGLRLVI